MTHFAQILCFEDSQVARLAPITTARPAYAISCGGFRLIDWLRELDLPLWGHCRPHLRTVQQLDFGVTSVDAGLPTGTPLLLVNARLIPCPAILDTLRRLLSSGQPALIRDQAGGVAAALVGGPLAPPPALRPASPPHEATRPSPFPGDRLLEQLTAGLPLTEQVAETFQWPHEVIAHHLRHLPAAMQWRIANGNYTQHQDGVFLAPGASIGPYSVIDTSAGPIILEADVQVGPFCFLSGPVHVGARSRVIAHSVLKDCVALGHTTKVGGEVEASVIEPYSNKQHHGFLGHSYLGSWINLGAGTCNSDLKNTYGNINIDYGDEKVATGMQFLGCVMGDYSKTAINTGIFTGKTVGVCSMLYGFVTSNVPSFVNYARLFGQTAPLPPEVMVSTQARMFARRKVQQRDCDRQLIFDMFDLTEEERHLLESISL